MTNANNPENQQKQAAQGSAVQIIARPKPDNLKEAAALVPNSDTEIIDALLSALELNSASLTKHVSALNGLTRGAYRISVRQSAEWNEITVTLRENTTPRPIATGFIDRGHTPADHMTAAADLRGLVRAYLYK